MPGGLGDVAEKELIGLFVDGEGLEQGFAEVESGGFGSGGWNRRHVGHLRRQGEFSRNGFILQSRSKQPPAAWGRKGEAVV